MHGPLDLAGQPIGGGDGSKAEDHRTQCASDQHAGGTGEHGADMQEGDLPMVASPQFAIVDQCGRPRLLKAAWATNCAPVKAKLTAT